MQLGLDHAERITPHRGATGTCNGGRTVILILGGGLIVFGGFRLLQTLSIDEESDPRKVRMSIVLIGVGLFDVAWYFFTQ